MKGLLLLLSLIFFLADYTKSHRSRGYDPLVNFLKRQRPGHLSHRYPENVLTEVEVSHVYVSPQDGLREADRILKLPGQPSVKFSQYSGYVTVDPTAGRALFYYLSEAEEALDKPLVLWLSRSPGSSSLGLGAMTEVGPFRVNPDSETLSYNSYAWNNVANMLFLESPAGVGFSYSNKSSDYQTGDKQTAADSYTFLANWLERFPEYKTRDFFIAGEGYAGHYVPQLADLILRTNKIANQTVTINLKGIAIGNAYIDYHDTLTGLYEHAWTSALISDETNQGIIENCRFSSSQVNESAACTDFQNKAAAEVGGIFIYDIYARLCRSNSSAPRMLRFEPCWRHYVSTYLNSPKVQKALHANTTGLPGPWIAYNSSIDNNWVDTPDTILPVIKDLMASQIRVWIYSGDTDGLIPVTATRYSMGKLESAVETPWYPWYSQGEVGGYVVEYQNVAFVTIRGAGQFVPSYQPECALAFFSCFIQGHLPPGHAIDMHH